MDDLAKRIGRLDAKKRELLGRKLEQLKAAQSTPPALPVLVSDLEHRYLPFPLTEIQQALWAGKSGFFDLGATGTNLVFEAEIDSSEEPFLGRKQLVDRLDGAFQKLIEQHEMLRTLVLSNVQQCILAKTPPYQIRIIDLQQHNSEVVEAELHAARKQMWTIKRCTDSWPLFDVLVYVLKNQPLRLLMRFEAMLIDGASFRILQQQLEQLLTEQDKHFIPLKCSFRDYALAWEAFQKSEQNRRDRCYWQKRSTSLPPFLELPYAMPLSPSVPSHFANVFFTLLEQEEWLELKAEALQRDLTPTIALTAAFIEVIGAWSRRQAFSLSIVGAYRPPFHLQISQVIGNFHTVYPLEVQSSTDTFENRARILHSQLTTMLEQRNYSSLRMLSEARRKKGIGSQAALILFNSVVEYAQPGLRGTKFHERRVKIKEVYETSGAYYPQSVLVWTIAEINGSLRCKCQVAENVFPEGMLQDIATVFTHFLTRLSHEKALWSEIRPQIIDAAYQKRFTARNNADHSLSKDLLPTLLLKQMIHPSDQVAVVTPDQVFTYDTLYQVANNLSCWLLDMGLSSGDLIAIVMEKGWELVAAMLGLLFSGIAFILIDPALQQKDLRLLLARTKVRIVVTLSHLSAFQYPQEIQKVFVDHITTGKRKQSLTRNKQKAEDIAYVIYTSEINAQDNVRKMTITHARIVNILLDIIQQGKMDSRDRIYWSSSAFTPDMLAFDIFGTLATGGTLVIPEKNREMWSNNLTSLVLREAITVWNTTPMLLDVFVTNAEEYSGTFFTSLRLILLSQDRIPRTLPSRAQNLAESVRIISLSGREDASGWFSLHQITSFNPDRRSFPVGQPLAHLKLHILNEQLEPCPVWVPGFLYVSGPGFMRQWWPDEEQNSQGGDIQSYPEEHLWPTGDVGRLLPDGTLELLGAATTWRAEVQGYPVELVQIEAVLERHPALRLAVVIGDEDDREPEHFTAYIIPHYGHSPTSEELRHFLLENLPEYMLPSSFVLLEAFPLHPNGSIDRSALRTLNKIFCNKAERSFVPSNNNLQAKLIQIWKDLLEIQTVKTTDNFFELGGTSFLATRMLLQMQKNYGRSISLYAFLKGNATIEQLAHMLQGDT